MQGTVTIKAQLMGEEPRFELCRQLSALPLFGPIKLPFTPFVGDVSTSFFKDFRILIFDFDLGGGGNRKCTRRDANIFGGGTVGEL